MKKIHDFIEWNRERTCILNALADSSMNNDTLTHHRAHKRKRTRNKHNKGLIQWNSNENIDATVLQLLADI